MKDIGPRRVHLWELKLISLDSCATSSLTMSESSPSFRRKHPPLDRYVPLHITTAQSHCINSSVGLADVEVCGIINGLIASAFHL